MGVDVFIAIRRFLALLLLPGMVVAAAPVEVVGLFKDRAVVRVTGDKEVMLRIGQTSKDGVTLLSADAHHAKVRYKGETHKLSLTGRVGGTFKEVTRQSISINSDSLGQYRIRGAINNQYVNFLVDTGASVVALSANTAHSLGIDYLQGREGTVQTAQGIVKSHFVDLAEVDVGGLKASNVAAAVIDGSYPTEILLGMSYLRKVKMEEDSGVLMLTR